MRSAQVNMNSEFTSIPRPALVKRDSRHKCGLQKELRRYEPRSIFPQNTAFSTPFRGVLPHPAAKSALRAEGATHSLAAKKPGWPQRSTGHCSPAPRLTLHAKPAGSGREQTLPHWLLPDTNRRFVKERTGPDRDERPLSIQYVTEPGDRFGQIELFLPARRRPTVDHSHVVGGDGRHCGRGHPLSGTKETRPLSPCSARVSRPRRSADRSSPGDALTVEDWETYGPRGRAGQETLPEPAAGAS